MFTNSHQAAYMSLHTNSVAHELEGHLCTCALFTCITENLQ